MSIQGSQQQNTDNEDFYANLPVLENFVDITHSENFYAVPKDWAVIITDIADSTKAIEAGRYKDVNLLGACSIIVILNLVGELEIPFVFGGDGASILIPSKFIEGAEQALLAVQKLADEEFHLTLRASVVPMEAITSNYEIKIAKLYISENYNQAILRGGGISYATQLVKDKAITDFYSPKPEKSAIADFSGLECRWQDIPTRHEEILSLIVQVTAPSQTQIDNLYREVINQIDRIYGKDTECHPVVTRNLQLAFRCKNLLSETRVFTASQSWLQKKLYLLKLRMINLLGLFLMTFDIKIGNFNWGNYKQIVSEATDFKKFDDVLRMVISGRAKQRQKLTDYLEKKFQEKHLVYGFHVSDRALMTCLVFERNGRQVHFVDGADGGYALAAKQMKELMKS
ncbi:MAG: DUF3095 domain-containing protein [Pseudanabaena sp. M57BS1SP1A06MG]|jgi:hypothetical protein|nr:DUF3095 domain-containing protein [Pseudanabaena sp. M051S1SP2A07QC]MCA6574582.1 DUF3095 domain-containing protein [Pseudanabaena sp. M53BS1SP1A06MG]MCA6584477.1 DUF3095 domain-containing protein [Pseudanabaena sp. M34BS1SP1A06MG]MCA6592285.1 DUF3095 domain-containing protein [Pseudanabaena sp. M38BS1SP1A06MG]MCA6596189.1 DUF3095 domain-containing protein [Pseudanabaena sp. M046S1SP1A06QC]MCA6599484.1 DUF3095 domain-containing protein [Pseudanabaena sp. M57BS1SP1A06MG]